MVPCQKSNLFFFFTSSIMEYICVFSPSSRFPVKLICRFSFRLASSASAYLNLYQSPYNFFEIRII